MPDRRELDKPRPHSYFRESLFLGEAVDSTRAPIHVILLSKYDDIPPPPPSRSFLQPAKGRKRLLSSRQKMVLESLALATASRFSSARRTRYRMHSCMVPQVTYL